MKISGLFSVCLLSMSLAFATNAMAEESVQEKADTKKNEALDSVKSTYRDAQDKACEMVNGKMQCLGKKIKNKSKNFSDKAKTKAKELENKVD